MERMRCAKALARPPVEADPVPKSREERLAIARATATEPLEKLRLKALDPNENYITRLNAQRDYQTLKASQARHGG
jgi:hypothetical protein